MLPLRYRQAHPAFEGATPESLLDWLNREEATENVVEIDFHDTGGPGSCGSFDANHDVICLYSSFEAEDGTIVDCDHSSDIISDTVAHELGHYLGLAESNCQEYMMGPMEWNSAGVPFADNELEPDEKEEVDIVNTNAQEEFNEECGGNPNCGDQGGNSPILIDLDGGWFRLSGLSDPVAFDIDHDGEAETVGWTSRGSGDGFLFRNRYTGSTTAKMGVETATATRSGSWDEPGGQEGGRR